MSPLGEAQPWVPPTRAVRPPSSDRRASEYSPAPDHHILIEAVAAFARDELLILLPAGACDWTGIGPTIGSGASRRLRMVVGDVEQARGAMNHLPPACTSDVRINPELRSHLLLADREVAVLIGEGCALQVLEARSQIARLVAAFERCWGHGRTFDKTSNTADTLQREILGRLAAGLTDQAVAKELGVSPRTVQRHVRKAKEEFGVDSRFELGMRLAKANFRGRSWRGLWRSRDAELEGRA
ncbi:LuxR family transcriptional regulator [Actinomadura logoneensis]|uniref:LuxR family transcriptional regulator n=1 Tax=Actinomadura logoneensis TaxID=2293572 RepID=A0A372JPB5_9ACTN|nr:helix-turn-helix transcriptional regulator [Actinomadura logoneensis]RFU41871.1 LuxR family transcriptional regulator [Actinomadura logoneensis]